MLNNVVTEICFPHNHHRHCDAVAFVVSNALICCKANSISEIGSMQYFYCFKDGLFYNDGVVCRIADFILLGRDLRLECVRKCLEPAICIIVVFNVHEACYLAFQCPKGTNIAPCFVVDSHELNHVAISTECFRYLPPRISLSAIAFFI